MSLKIVPSCIYCKYRDFLFLEIKIGFLVENELKKKFSLQKTSLEDQMFESTTYDVTDTFESWVIVQILLHLCIIY